MVPSPTSREAVEPLRPGCRSLQRTGLVVDVVDARSWVRPRVGDRFGSLVGSRIGPRLGHTIVCGHPAMRTDTSGIVSSCVRTSHRIGTDIPRL